MAQILSNIKQNALAKKVDKLRSQIKYVIDVQPVYEEINREKDSKKVLRLKANHEAKLKKYFNNTLSSEEHLQVNSEQDLKKLDETFYWKTRRINHIYNKLSEKNKADESSRDIELEKLSIWYNDTKALIIAKHTIVRTDEEVNQNKVLYNEKKLELKNKLDEYELHLANLTAKKVLKFNSNLEIKLANLKEKFNAAKLKLNEQIEKNGQVHHMEDENVILEIKNLTMQFGGLKAVNDLTFNVKKGEIFGLIGPNGAGKTTVFNCITQFYKATSGTVHYRNINDEIVKLNNYKVHNVIKQGVVRTFQNVELIWEVSILDNMLVGAHSAYRTGFFSHLVQALSFKREEAIYTAKAMKILTDLDIVQYAYAYPMGLPYGVLKKIELARTLMTNPNLIILDEPAAGLNDSETMELAKLIKKIQKEYNCTIFLVEHDMGLVMDICDTICAISFGKMLGVGTPKEIQDNPLVKEAYLGGE